MVFKDVEFQAIKKEIVAFVKRIFPSAKCRPALDIYSRIHDQMIEMGEVRPVCAGASPGETFEIPSARLTYIRPQKVWMLHGKHASGMWAWYATCNTLAEVFELDIQDHDGCFFGR